MLNKILALPLLLFVKTYQWVLSPLFPSVCRHEPSCSEYAKQALEKYGIVAGSWLSFKRILRCHPWGTCGFDPVPEIPLKKTAQK